MSEKQKILEQKYEELVKKDVSVCDYKEWYEIENIIVKNVENGMIVDDIIDQCLTEKQLKIFDTKKNMHEFIKIIGQYLEKHY